MRERERERESDRERVRVRVRVRERERARERYLSAVLSFTVEVNELTAMSESNRVC